MDVSSNNYDIRLFSNPMELKFNPVLNVTIGYLEF